MMASNTMICALMMALVMAGPASAARSLRLPNKESNKESIVTKTMRQLRQVTDSFTTQGGNPYNNPVQIYARAREAEAWSHSKAIGIFQKQPGATVVTAGEQYPSARSQAVTQNGQQGPRGRARSAGGFVAGNPVTLFGTTAIASTDLGARAFAGSGSIPMVDREPGALRQASSISASRWEAAPMRTGTGARIPGSRAPQRIVFSDATAATERAPLSQAISENGGGPMAHAQAGDAVAMSFADTNENDRYGSGSRR